MCDLISGRMVAEARESYPLTAAAMQREIIQVDITHFLNETDQTNFQKKTSWSDQIWE